MGPIVDKKIQKCNLEQKKNKLWKMGPNSVRPLLPSQRGDLLTGRINGWRGGIWLNTVEAEALAVDLLEISCSIQTRWGLSSDIHVKYNTIPWPMIKEKKNLVFPRNSYKFVLRCKWNVFLYCWIWKSSKNQEDCHLPFLDISSSSRVIKV